MNAIVKSGLAASALTAALSVGIFIGQATADQPHMQNALTALERARTELQTANPDKGGHRVKALNLVNQAIEETQAGIRYAR